MVAQSGKISDTTTLLESLSPNSDSISRARGDVKIFIVYKGDTVQIPVNPSDLKIATPGNNKTYPIELSICANRQFRTNFLYCIN